MGDNIKHVKMERQNNYCDVDRYFQAYYIRELTMHYVSGIYKIGCFYLFRGQIQAVWQQPGMPGVPGRKSPSNSRHHLPAVRRNASW